MCVLCKLEAVGRRQFIVFAEQVRLRVDDS